VLADRGELSLKLGNFRCDCMGITVAESAKLVCNAALKFRGLAAQVRIALPPRRDGFGEFLLETLQRVIDDLGMQHPLLQAGQELAFEIPSANQQAVFANAFATLRMH